METLGYLFVFLAGVIFQCLSLIHSRPPRWSYYIFFGMIAYSLVLIIISFNSYDSSYFTQKGLDAIIAPFFSFGFIFAFLFIAIFLKQILTTIDENTLISLTVSFWFLFLEYYQEVNLLFQIIFSLLAIYFSFYSYRLIYSKEKQKPVLKLFSYLWFLLVNGLFALSYFSELPHLFIASGGLFHTGKESSLELFSLGMVIVQLTLNFGILYYGILYSLFSPELRQQILINTEQLMSDEQVDSKLKWILLAQIISFIFFYIFENEYYIYILCFWLLSFPALNRLLLFYNKQAKNGFSMIEDIIFRQALIFSSFFVFSFSYWLRLFLVARRHQHFLGP